MKDKTKLNKSLYYVLPVIAIIVVIGIAIKLIQPKIADTQQTQQLKAQEEDTQKKLEVKLAELDKLKQNETDINAQLSAMSVALPNEKNVPELIIQIQKIAQESQVEVQAIQLAPGKLINDTTAAVKGIPQLAMNLSVKGNYTGIKTFLGKLYKAKRLLSMDSINLNISSAQETDGSINLVTEVNAYYQPLQPAPKDDTLPVAKLTTEEKDTFEKLKQYNSYDINQSTPVPVAQ